MFVLVLNDMRMPQIEQSMPVLRAPTKEALEALLAKERVETYRDGRWSKSFRQGGPLEWYNQPFFQFDQGIIDVGTEESWAEEARQRFRDRIMSIPGEILDGSANPHQAVALPQPQ